MSFIDFDNEEHKEVCAQLGLATFLGQTLETALTCLLLANAKLQGTVVTTEEFEDLEATLQRKTLGFLVNKARTEVKLPETTEQIIVYAVERRNHLIHHFVREREFANTTAAGRKQMLSELCDMQRVFVASQKLADEVLRGLARSLGITPEMLVAEVAELQREADAA